MSPTTLLPDRHERTHRHDERGSGLLSSVIGLGCVVVVLGVAANLTLGLWVRSTVDSVAHDAARDLATAPAGSDRALLAPQVLDRARASLGAHGERVRLDVERADDDLVVLHVRAPGVSLLPAIIDGGPVVGGVDRRIVVRSEGP